LGGLHLRCIAFPVDAIDEGVVPPEITVALQRLAEALGDADGRLVLRVDEADDAVPLQNGERIVQGGPGCLRGVATAPPAPHEGPAKLETAERASKYATRCRIPNTMA